MKTRQNVNPRLLTAVGAVLLSAVLLLAMVSVGSLDVAAAATTFEDDCSTLDKVSEKSSDNWVSQPEKGATVIMKTAANTDTDAYIIYKAPAGKAFTSFSMDFIGYTGFYNLGQLVISVLADGQSDYVKINTEQSGDARTTTDAGFEAKTIVPSDAFPAKIAAVKISLTNDVYYATMIDKVTMTVDDMPQSTDFEDDCSSLDNISEKSDDGWVSQPEKGRDVIKKDTASLDAYIAYAAPAGKAFTDLKIEFVGYTGFFTNSQLVVSVLYDDETEYENLAMKQIGDPADTNDDAFKVITLGLDVALVGNITKVKITIAHDVHYAIMLSNIKMAIDEPSVYPPRGDEPGPPEPDGGKIDLEWTKYPSLPAAPSSSLLFFTDGMEQADKYWNDSTGEWDAFGQNPQFEYPDDDEKYGIGKKSQDPQYFTYKKGTNGVGDEYIKNFEFDCSLYGGTFWGTWLPTPFKEGDLKVYYRLEGSDSFVSLEVGHTDLTEVNDSGLYFTTYRPMAALPDKVVEIKFELCNEWGYGIYAHEARLYKAEGGAGIPTTTTTAADPGNVNTGVSSPFTAPAALLSSVILCAIIVFIGRRRTLNQ